MRPIHVFVAFATLSTVTSASARQSSRHADALAIDSIELYNDDNNQLNDEEYAAADSLADIDLYNKDYLFENERLAADASLNEVDELVFPSAHYTTLNDVSNEDWAFADSQDNDNEYENDLYLSDVTFDDDEADVNNINFIESQHDADQQSSPATTTTTTINADNADVLSGNLKLDDESIDPSIALNTRANTDSSIQLLSEEDAPEIDSNAEEQMVASSEQSAAQSAGEEPDEHKHLYIVMAILIPLLAVAAMIAIIAYYRRKQDRVALQKLIEKTQSLDSIYHPSTVKTQCNTPTHELDADWSVCFDESGRKYYVNNTTGVSQWAKPEKFQIRVE